jgi:hypothetical protein
VAEDGDELAVVFADERLYAFTPQIRHEHTERLWRRLAPTLR